MSLFGIKSRRGLILPIALLILLMIGLLAAGFAFRVNADRSSFNAVTYRLQARLAAEAGIEKVLLMLRTRQGHAGDFYNNPDELNRIIVWTPDDETVWGTNEELDEGTVAYRFSIVADDPFDDEERCRYGLTDEPGKLNLNTATKEQLARLIGQVATEEDMIVEELVDALIDWRDEDSTPGEFGAEANYYASLDTPYKPKNGPFDTVEELLLVKGFDGRVLYGEDQDRNGIVTPNEDDGDESFPEDNSDGQLNRGLYPYVTVYSYDLDFVGILHPRIYLCEEEELMRGQLAELFDNPAKVDFIVAASHGGGTGGPAPGEPGGECLPDGSCDDGLVCDATANLCEEKDEGGPSPGELGGECLDDGTCNDKLVCNATTNLCEEEGGGDPTLGGPGGECLDDGTCNDKLVCNATTNLCEEEDESDPAPSGPGGECTQFASPADLLTAEAGEMVNPLTVEDLPILMKHTTVVNPNAANPIQEPLGVGGVVSGMRRGLVNIMTAPPQVLRSLGLSGEQVAAILETRGGLTDEARETSAWLVTEGVLGLEAYAGIAGAITTRSLQFTIESLGYADHVGAICRLQVLVELRDILFLSPQVLYYRDLTSLGAVFPIREDEAEYGFGGQRG